MADIIDFEEKRKKKLEEEGNGKLADDIGPREVGCELQDALREDQNGNGVLSNALSAPGKKPTQAELLIQLAHQSATFFHTLSMEPFGCIGIRDHQEIWPLRSKPFRMWLPRLLYESIGKMPHNKAIEDASTQFQGDALYNGPCHDVFILFANHDGAIYVDMTDEDWNQIEITKKGWQKIPGKDSPVKFMRSQGMLPIANLSQQGSINVLSEFLNLESQTEFQLMVGWLIGAAQPNGPFPILLLQGEQGSAKSTTARLLRSIIDPSTIPLRTLPRSERDLLIAAGKCWVMNFDNLSDLQDWLSDALCRIVTGSGFGTRTLYTDDSEFLFSASRPIIMNGISDVATRHDLADICVIVHLPPIKTGRMTEREFWHKWECVVGALYLMRFLQRYGILMKFTYPYYQEWQNLQSGSLRLRTSCLGKTAHLSRNTKTTGKVWLIQQSKPTWWLRLSWIWPTDWHQLKNGQALRANC